MNDLRLSYQEKYYPKAQIHKRILQTKDFFKEEEKSQESGNSQSTCSDEECENERVKRMFTLNNAKKDLAHIILTQYGCRLYQKRIMSDPIFCNNFLYPTLVPYMLTLINNQFGNYLYQLFIDLLNPINFQHFLSFIDVNFMNIAYAIHGTRVIQKLIEKMNYLDENSQRIFELMARNIHGNVKKMAIDQHANHVLQKFISFSRHFPNDFLYEEISQNFMIIAKTKHGCCVIQKCLVYGTTEQKANLTAIILHNLFELMSEQFGNYVVQGLIVTSEDWVVSSVFRLISNDIIPLCKAKYTSNAIEKFFEIKNIKLLNEFANCMLQFKSNIYELICNEFGNYIIQKILFSTTDEALKFKILSVINKHIDTIAKIPYGKSFLVKIKKKTPSFSIYMDHLL